MQYANILASKPSKMVFALQARTYHASREHMIDSKHALGTRVRVDAACHMHGVSIWRGTGEQSHLLRWLGAFSPPVSFSRRPASRTRAGSICPGFRSALALQSLEVLESKCVYLSEVLHALRVAILYSTLLYSTLLYSTLLYSTLLYSTLLYSTILTIPCLRSSAS